MGGVRIMLPERMKQLRKEKGITQTDLAKALSVSSVTVAMWEIGKRKPSFELFDRLTEVFDRRIDYILGASDDASPLKVAEGEAVVTGNWIVNEEYEDIMRKFSLLDEFGQKTVASVLRTEFARCQEQGTLLSGKSVSVTVKVREVHDPINEDVSD